MLSFRVRFIFFQMKLQNKIRIKFSRLLLVKWVHHFALFHVICHASFDYIPINCLFHGNITIRVFRFLFVVIVCLLLVVPQHYFVISITNITSIHDVFFSFSISLRCFVFNIYLFFAWISIRTVIKSNERHESKFPTKQKRHNREAAKKVIQTDSCK